MGNLISKFRQTMNHQTKFVTKRNGNLAPFNEEKIRKRLQNLIDMNPKLTNVKCEKVVKMTLSGTVPGIKTSELDELSMANAASLINRDPEYGTLASRIAISNLIKMTPKTFSECSKIQYNNVHPKLGFHCPLISEKHMQLIKKNSSIYDAMIVPERDYDFDYFGYKTMEKSYLKRVGPIIQDRPGYMFMRVAIALHGEDFVRVKETYDLMSQKYFTHATPTLFNACSVNQQLSSCFLLSNQDDSIEGLYNTYKQLAHISKMSGGIGIAYQNVRASGSYIKGTNGSSKGLIPFARMLNDTARAVDQGGGKRNGAFSITTEPWHADTPDFLKMKSVSGDENKKCRDLFPAMWIPDLFFKRVINKEEWSLFCPNEAPNLNTTWGKAFEELYEKYEKTSGLVRQKMDARKMYRMMVHSMIESNVYMLAKDTTNRKSNHQHLGTIQNMNLCCEVAQYSSPEEISVCTLASIALPSCIRDGKFDHMTLYSVVRVATRNLDIIVDENMYPPSGDDLFEISVSKELLMNLDEEKAKELLQSFKTNPKKFIKIINRAERSSALHRSIGIGVQGLADVFMILGLPFESLEAKQLNRDIFETMYFAALTESNELAKEKGQYPSYPGSPMSQGIYQFHFWNTKPSDRWDWNDLEEKRKLFGMRNSLLIAPMPTKSTSHIFGFTECFEPPHSMMFKARVLAGEFDIINKYLINTLKSRGMWNKDMREKILAERGSVQKVEGFPEDLKKVYKTVWEIKMKTIIDMAADRGAFIDQSQSMNLWLPEADVDKVASMIIYAWKKGLKTLCYYLHIKAVAESVPYTANADMVIKKLFDTDEGRFDVSTILNQDSKTLSENVNPLGRDEEDARRDEDVILCEFNDGCGKACSS